MRSPGPGDRRNSPRGRVTIAVRERADGRTYLCQADDISEHGMLLAKVYEEDSDHAPPRCCVDFALPGSTSRIVAEARVVRSVRRHRYRLTAVEFVRISETHREQIARYLAGPETAASRPPFVDA